MSQYDVKEIFYFSTVAFIMIFGDLFHLRDADFEVGA